MITGRCGPWASRMRAQVSKPLMPGSRTSSRTRSKPPAASASRPRSPDSARSADVAVQAQQIQQRLADVWVVVDDQDLGHERKGSFAPVAAGVKAAELYWRLRSPSSMYPTSAPRDGLALLAEAFRSRRTGVLVVGEGQDAIHVRLEAGQVVALGPPAPEAQAAKLPKPSDSVHLRLERVLAEIGMRKPTEAPRQPEASTSTPLSSASLRERLIASLAEDVRPVRFDDGAPSPEGVVAVSVVTEPLILEAVRQMRHDEAVLKAIGDLDQLLVATTALADERTLTLTEGYLLSRIDGLASARQVLELVPLDPGDVERTLLGLLLTGRVETRPAPYPRRVPAPAPVAPPPAAPPLPAAEPPQPEAAHEEAMPVAEAIPEASEEPPWEAPVAEPVEEPVTEPAEELPKTAPHIVAEWTRDESTRSRGRLRVDRAARGRACGRGCGDSDRRDSDRREPGRRGRSRRRRGRRELAESSTAEYPFAASVASAAPDGEAVEAQAAASQPAPSEPTASRRSTHGGTRAPPRGPGSLPVAPAQEPLRGAGRRARLQRRRGEARLRLAHEALPPRRAA